MRFELAIFLLCVAAAMAVAHVVLTSRDRGGITSATLAVGAVRAVLLLKKLLPAR